MSRIRIAPPPRRELAAVTPEKRPVVRRTLHLEEVPE
jgi:hypothetical protein